MHPLLNCIIGCLFIHLHRVSTHDMATFIKNSSKSVMLENYLKCLLDLIRIPTSGQNFHKILYLPQDIFMFNLREVEDVFLWFNVMCTY